MLGTSVKTPFMQTWFVLDNIVAYYDVGLWSNAWQDCIRTPYATCSIVDDIDHHLG